MSRFGSGLAAAAAVAIVCLGAGQAAAKDGPKSARQCFLSRDYEGFRPIDDHSFYIRVNVNDFYRIELEGACPEITYPDARLITVVRGSDEICGPLDWDLKVGESPPSIPVPCIVKSQTKLTPAEAAAIPRKQKP
ncbi:MAG: DUF6491 family protein [Caulobacteraceae bacterium]